ncbi:hypothetical protein Dxin01_00519 [Deinococcus xinjiangensis]|uniref:Lipoprotein n=1 Tax=Deinococcus xinjiangensis TaxID=457454 RepID=A0ABP9V687_9DEIO
MPAPTLPRLAAATLLAASLGACGVPQGVRTLNFVAGPAGENIDPARLLLDQVVPADRLLSVPEAVRRAPDGSVILVCNATAGTLSWGVCSHISRKFSAGIVTDSPSIFAGGVQNRPESTLYRRHAVIVLDVGVTPELLPRLRAEAERLKGTPYNIAGLGDTFDCTTYQNALQAALGLPAVAARNPSWHIWLPQDALTGPAMQAGGKVLWVGMEGVP